MADYLACYVGPQDILLETGKGHVPGVILTSTNAVAGAMTLYDYASVGPPTGPKILELMVSIAAPVSFFFNNRYAPKFNDGIWLHLSDHCYLTVWYHIPNLLP